MFARRVKEGIARGDCTAVHRILQQVSRHVVLEESDEIHKVHARSDIDANQHVFRRRRIITYMCIAPQNVCLDKELVEYLINTHLIKHI